MECTEKVEQLICEAIPELNRAPETVLEGSGRVNRSW